MSEANHDTVSDLLAGAAFEVLEPAEAQLVVEHVSRCAQCRAELEAYRQVVDRLGASLDSGGSLDAQSHASARAKLLTRVGTGAGAARLLHRRPAPTRPHARPYARWLGWSGWAVAAGLSGLLLMHHGIHQPLGTGWIAAGAIAIVASCLGMYAVAQRRRIRSLQTELDREPDLGSHPR